MPDVYARSLRRAAQIVGGLNELAARLGVPGESLALWLMAKEPVPLGIFLQAVDVIVAHGLEQVGNEPTIEIQPPAKPPDRAGDDEPTIEIAPPNSRDSEPGKPG